MIIVYQATLAVYQSEMQPVNEMLDAKKGSNRQ